MENSFIYARKITNSNYSPDLATQLYNCQQCAEFYNYKVINTYTEVSNKKLKSYPIFEQMKKDLKGYKIRNLIIYSLSVLGRNLNFITKFVKEMKRRKINVIFVDIDASPDKHIFELLFSDYILRNGDKK